MHAISMAGAATLSVKTSQPTPSATMRWALNASDAVKRYLVSATTNAGDGGDRTVASCEDAERLRPRPRGDRPRRTEIAAPTFGLRSMITSRLQLD